MLAAMHMLHIIFRQLPMQSGSDCLVLDMHTVLGIRFTLNPRP